MCMAVIALNILKAAAKGSTLSSEMKIQHHNIKYHANTWTCIWNNYVWGHLKLNLIMILACESPEIFFLVDLDHDYTYKHTGIFISFFFPHTPTHTSPEGKKSTNCMIIVEQWVQLREPNIRGPVNAPRSILSPQTTRRMPDKMTQTLLKSSWRKETLSAAITLEGILYQTNLI